MARGDQTTDAPAPLAEGEVAQTWYVVLHNAVAGWWQGQAISDRHLVGHDIARLLRLGAIAEVDSIAHQEAARDGLAMATPEGVSVDEPVPLPAPPEESPAASLLPASAENG